jgi:hypothetical protein
VPEGYKVMRRRVGDPGVFLPATGYGELITRYWLGEETVPYRVHQGPLAVFDCLEQAVRWIGQVWFAQDLAPHPVVARCRYEPSDEQQLWVYACSGGYDGKPVFVRIAAGQHCKPLSTCPEGTILARSVTPLEIVLGQSGRIAKEEIAAALAAVEGQ